MVDNIPRSLMFITPGALELVRLCLGVFSSVGELDSPWTAESTLVKGAGSASFNSAFEVEMGCVAVSADMIAGQE